MKFTKFFIIFTLLLFSTIGLYRISATGIPSQQNSFQNELNGFEFFGKGKLGTLNLGKSKKKDVAKIFGGNCEQNCDYDENFKIRFEYVKALDDCMTTKDVRDRLMCPQNEFVGTISSITLEPKQNQIIKDIPTSTFNKVSGGGSVEKGSGNSSYYTSFTDKYGLRYSITNESSKVSISSQYPPIVGGKLHSVKYIFTDDFIRKAFTIESKTRKNELNK